MSDWKPKVRPDLDWVSLDISAEEGFVLSRLDGNTHARDLTNLTGLPPARLEGILARLHEQGVFDGAPPFAEAPEVPAPKRETLKEALDEAEEALDEAEEALDEADEALDEAEEDVEEVEEEIDEALLGNLRKLYHVKLAELSRDERLALAREVADERLGALCFDPEPRVIHAILENPNADVPHARLIAAHHLNAAGLDALARKRRYLRDPQCERHLLRNVQTRETILREIFTPKRLLPLYKLNVSHELSERAKRVARQSLRQGFQRASSDEKVNLLFKTEARCLNLFIGVSLDGKSIALLCGRPIHSTLMIQNLARWSATPPPVLQHLARQPTVKRSAQLRRLIQRHPNTPSQLKRSL